MNLHRFVNAVATNVGRFPAAFALQAIVSELKLVAVTGYGQKSDLDHALAAGFDEHMTKTVDAPRIFFYSQRDDKKRTSKKR